MAFDAEHFDAERNMHLREPDLIDYWFPALGLPETRQNGPGQWTATGPCGQVIVDHAGDILARTPDDPDNLIREPLDFVAEVLGLFDDDGDYDRDTAWRLASGQEAYAPGACMMDGFTSAATFDGVPVPARVFHVDGMVPDQSVTLLSGDGGVGKSLLALQLAAATAAGTSWLGLPVRKGRALYLSAEDGLEELHRRLADIASAEGLDWPDLSDLMVRSTLGQNALLAEKGREGFKPSPLLHSLEKAARDPAVKLVAIDTLANFYPGDENDRAQTTQFLDLIKGLALRCECAVVLLAHPSKSAMETGAGYSGSTAWHNAVRSRLYFRRVLSRDGDRMVEDDPDVRLLTLAKANYAATGGENLLRYSLGRFVPVSPETSLDRAAAAAKAERVFLRILDEHTGQGRFVSPSPSSTYAPTVFSKRKAAEGCTKRELAAAMETLFERGEIEVAEHGRGASLRRHIRRAQA